ncbi:unnamed protein product [Porites evermanni]|uniref:Uncharacterized protein n=1 Tax=Porites evermanni TaxID=104178 RepID=A0ABN8MAI0_9CNID|nr:unnamed protein product [Porites evermanni]
MSARGGKRYGSGRRLLSPGSFVRSIEKRSDSRSSSLKSHGRIYVRRDILDTFKTLKAQCVFSTDTAFLQHLLSFEMRRQQSLKAKQALKKSTEESRATLCHYHLVISVSMKFYYYELMIPGSHYYTIRAINMSGLMATVTTSQSLRKTTSFHGLTGDPKSLRHCKKLSWILTFLKVSSTTPDSGEMLLAVA